LTDLRGILLAVSLLGPPGPADAVLLAADAERAHDAVRELGDAVAQAEGRSSVPRVANPALADLFAAALPAAATTGPPPAGEEIERLIEASRRAKSLAHDYLLIGVPDGNAQAPDGKGQAARNFIIYLPELARIYDFRIRVHGRLAEGAAALRATMPDGLENDPNIARGFAVISDETRAVIDATLAASADVNIDPEWRISRLSVLLTAAPAFAALFDVKGGQRIADRALAMAIAEREVAIALLLKNFALAILR
jgi:hypothetical protein